MLIKPCPFCGNADAPHVWDTEEESEGIEDAEYELAYQVVCSVNHDGNPGCGSSSGWYPNKDAAVEIWNKRAPTV